ncbi:MAG: hypothetical protein U0353_06900 [Sandaracinus sp.]
MTLRRSMLAVWALSLFACSDPPPPTAPAAAPAPVPPPTATSHEPLPVAPERPAEPAAPATPSPPSGPDPLAPTTRTSATAAEIERARTRCNEGWAAFQAERFEEARAAMDESLPVLAVASDDAGRRAYGACLYNRGRWAEHTRWTEQARALYARSLEVRPSDAVAARLASLPPPAEAIASPPEGGSDPAAGGAIPEQDESPPMERPTDAEAAALFDSPMNPCAHDEHCAFALLPPVAGASDVRWVEVWRHDGEAGLDFPEWRGSVAASVTLRLALVRDGALSWGPTLASYSADMSQRVSLDPPRLDLLQRPADAPRIVHATVHASIEERCCGGSATDLVTEEVYCALHGAAPASCAHALTERSSESTADDPGDEGYESGSTRFTARTSLEGTTLHVETTTGTPPTYRALPTDDSFGVHRAVTDTIDLSTL